MMNTRGLAVLSKAVKNMVKGKIKALYFKNAEGSELTIAETLRVENVLPALADTRNFRADMNSKFFNFLAFLKFLENHKDKFVIIFVDPIAEQSLEYLHLCKAIVDPKGYVIHISMNAQIEFNFTGKVLFIVDEVVSEPRTLELRKLCTCIDANAYAYSNEDEEE